MKKNLLVLIGLTAMVCFMAGPGWAQDGKAHTGGMWGVSAGYGFVDSSNPNNPKHQGFATIGYDFVDYVGMDIEAAITGGRTTMYSGFLDLLLKLPWYDLAIYAKGGVGMQAHRFSRFGNYNDAFSKRVGGGLEYFFTKNFAINAEALYVWGGDDTFEAPQYRGALKLYF